MLLVLAGSTGSTKSTSSEPLRKLLFWVAPGTTSFSRSYPALDSRTGGRGRREDTFRRDTYVSVGSSGPTTTSPTWPASPCSRWSGNNQFCGEPVPRRLVRAWAGLRHCHTRRHVPCCDTDAVPVTRHCQRARARGRGHRDLLGGELIDESTALLDAARVHAGWLSAEDTQVRGSGVSGYPAVFVIRLAGRETLPSR